MALVTGASRGIGSKIAEDLSSKGVFVWINYSRDVEGAKNTRDIIKDNGGECELIKADVSDYEQVEEMLKQITQKHSYIDILVNNAGIVKDKKIANMDKQMWEDVINVNLNGMFYVTKVALPFIPKGGNIINISSLSARVCVFGQANYASAKAGMNAFTKVASKELGMHGIRVNAISPGFIETSFIGGIPDKLMKMSLELIPLGRVGKVEDVSSAVIFILGNNYINGEILEIGGGL